MVRLGAGNSRMKDFWDMVPLSQEFECDGYTLRTAIDETPAAWSCAEKHPFIKNGTVRGWGHEFVRSHMAILAINDQVNLRDPLLQPLTFDLRALTFGWHTPRSGHCESF